VRVLELRVQCDLRGGVLLYVRVCVCERKSICVKEFAICVSTGDLRVGRFTFTCVFV